MKYKVGQIVELRDGTLTFITDIQLTMASYNGTRTNVSYPISTAIGYSYTLNGSLREGEINPKDIISLGKLMDGTEFIIKHIKYIVYNNSVHKFEKKGDKYEKS